VLYLIVVMLEAFLTLRFNLVHPVIWVHGGRR
jgi:hypothetical protein